MPTPESPERIIEACYLILMSTEKTVVSCPLCGKTVKAGHQHECHRNGVLVYGRTWKLHGKRPPYGRKRAIYANS